MLDENKKKKISAYIFLGLFLWMQFYFCSFETLKDSAISGALILNIV
ncbi:MAG: hypothetical protein ACXVHV_11050 [Methanobacterium sp.]